MIRQILIFLICSGTIFCQTSTTLQIKADYDFAQFRGNENQTIFEIYYAIPRENLSHVSTDGGFMGAYKITLNISKDGNTISSLDWQGTDKINSLEEIKSGQSINDVKTLLFKPGIYGFEMVIADLNNGSENKYHSAITILDFRNANLNVSSIQFAHQIQKAQSANRFVKNGYQITPNPTLIYNTNQPILFYYFELYNLNRFEDSSKLFLSSFITNQSGEKIKSLPDIQYEDVNESIVVVNNVYVGALFTGIYFLNMEIVNPEFTDTVRQKKQFYVYRPADQIALAKDIKTNESKVNQYAFMSEDELDREFDYLRYTIDDEAKDRYEELNLAAKREYLNIFWTETENASPGFRKEFYDRIEFANRRYTIGAKDGWKTQNGRVVIMYGIPDGIEKQTSVSTMRDYEIWTYESLEGGAMFVFVNTTGYGELRLVHSTVMDEIKDFDWQARYLR